MGVSLAARAGVRASGKIRVLLTRRCREVRPPWIAADLPVPADAWVTAPPAGGGAWTAARRTGTDRPWAEIFARPVCSSASSLFSDGVRLRSHRSLKYGCAKCIISDNQRFGFTGGTSSTGTAG